MTNKCFSDILLDEQYKLKQIISSNKLGQMKRRVHHASGATDKIDILANTLSEVLLAISLILTKESKL